jgi:hypothetical protein
MSLVYGFGFGFAAFVVIALVVLLVGIAGALIWDLFKGVGGG